MQCTLITVQGIYAVGPGGSRAKNIPWRYKDADGHWHTTKGQHAQPFLGTSN